MDYSAFDAARAGFRRAVLVVRPETEADFRDTVGRRIGSHLAVEYIHQTPELPAGSSGIAAVRRKPWGTGHAVLAARPAVSGRFAVINADDFYGAESYRSIAAFLRDPVAPVPPTSRSRASGSDRRCRLPGRCRAGSAGPTATASSRPSPSSSRFTGTARVAAVARDARGGEQRLTGDELVSMNMWAFTPAVFDELERLFTAFLERSAADPAAEFLLPAAIQSLIEGGRARVRVLPEAGRWCGITYREDRDAVAAHIAGLVARGVYPSGCGVGACGHRLGARELAGLGVCVRRRGRWLALRPARAELRAHPHVSDSPEESSPKSAAGAARGRPRQPSSKRAPDADRQTKTALGSSTRAR